MVKNLPANTEGTGSVPEWERPLAGGHSNPTPVSCQEIPWTTSQAGYSPRGRAESDTAEPLSVHTGSEG